MNSDKFKFRVWSNNCKCYIDNVPDIISETGDMPTHEIVEPGNDCILEQCSGLKDCSGKLIFEGDIVDAWSQGQNLKMLVKWGDGTCKFFLFHEKTLTGWNLSGGGKDYNEESIEIIGNILEKESKE